MPDDLAIDYDFGEKAAALRVRLRQLIKEHIPAGFLGAFSNNPEDLALTQSFCKLLADEGLLCLTWPEEYGGGGGSVWEQTTVREEMWAHHEPRGAQYMGVNWVGPALMRHGTPEQRAKHLPPISAGEVIWCQGFSEPEAGTDLASLRTRATPEGSVDGAEGSVDGAEGAGWLITGQKVWTSYALMAQWCVLAATTDPELPSAERLTLFLVPMDREGIEVRPIASMLGPHHLNEVFLDSVRVGPEDVLGKVGGGWAVMRDALAYERVGIARYARCESLLARLLEVLEDEGQWELLAPALHARWVRALIDLRVAKLLAYRAVGEQNAGIDPAAAAAARIVTTTCDQAVAEVLMEAAGAVALDSGKDGPIAGAIDDHWRYAQAATVASGTIEVQRILVARSVLGSAR